jgi:hypothetical protein
VVCHDAVSDNKHALRILLDPYHQGASWMLCSRDWVPDPYLWGKYDWCLSVTVSSPFQFYIIGYILTMTYSDSFHPDQILLAIHFTLSLISPIPNLVR